MAKKKPTQSAGRRATPTTKTPKKPRGGKKKKSQIPEAPVQPVRKRKKTLVFDCSTFTQGGHRIALFSCSAALLWDVVQINRRQENKDTGYQRAISQARVNSVAKYVEGGGMIPNSVLVSFDPGATIRRDGTQIRIPDKADAGWVIDGQHRLAGAHASEVDIEVPVAAFVDLDLPDQIRCFVTINREQKGVPSSLYYELLPHLPGERSEVEATKLSAKDLGNALAVDEESPFFGRIVSTTAPNRGTQLSMTNFIRKLHPLVKRSGALGAWKPDERRRILNAYYKAIREVFPEEFDAPGGSVFFQTLAFGALMEVLPTWIYEASTRFSGLATSDFVKLFNSVSSYSFSDLQGQGTGSSYEKSVARELEARLQAALKGSQAKASSIRLE